VIEYFYKGAGHFPCAAHFIKEELTFINPTSQLVVDSLKFKLEIVNTTFILTYNYVYHLQLIPIMMMITMVHALTMHVALVQVANLKSSNKLKFKQYNLARLTTIFCIN